MYILGKAGKMQNPKPLKETTDKSDNIKFEDSYVMEEKKTPLVR